jgi:hypothetical protein
VGNFPQQPGDPPHHSPETETSAGLELLCGASNRSLSRSRYLRLRSVSSSRCRSCGCSLIGDIASRSGATNKTMAAMNKYLALINKL